MWSKQKKKKRSFSLRAHSLKDYKIRKKEILQPIKSALCPLTISWCGKTCLVVFCFFWQGYLWVTQATVNIHKAIWLLSVPPLPHWHNPAPGSPVSWVLGLSDTPHSISEFQVGFSGFDLPAFSPAGFWVHKHARLGFFFPPFLHLCL